MDIIINSYMQKKESGSSSSSSYFPFAIPPSLKLCLEHRLCSQFGETENGLEDEGEENPRMNTSCKIVGYFRKSIKEPTLPLLWGESQEGSASLMQYLPNLRYQRASWFLLHIYQNHVLGALHGDVGLRNLHSGVDHQRVSRSSMLAASLWDTDSQNRCLLQNTSHNTQWSCDSDPLHFPGLSVLQASLSASKKYLPP